MSRILVTGAAGFIGFHVAKTLLDAGHHVASIDNMNSYYDPTLKNARLGNLTPYPHFEFIRAGIEDKTIIDKLFTDFKPDYVVHLAAQAGVRYSIDNPLTYIDSNITGFAHILESCRHHSVKHLIFASSSSVYGANTTTPFRTSDNVDHPLSLYAATKKSNELMAHTYANLYDLPVTGLRFFTVYGPWSRPDMATFKFTKAIFEGTPIDVYNNGNMKRDFTYIDDIVDGIIRLLDHPPQKNGDWDAATADTSASFAPYKIYNIGNNQPVALTDMIDTLEAVIGKKAVRVMKPMQPGDVLTTYADISDLQRDVGFVPKTGIKEGLQSFVEWYKAFYTQTYFPQ